MFCSILLCVFSNLNYYYGHNIKETPYFYITKNLVNVSYVYQNEVSHKNSKFKEELCKK